MRRRIVVVAVVAALLATGLFGIPLAGMAAQFFLDTERNDLERVAQAAAVGAAADLAHGRPPARLESGGENVTLGLFDRDGTLLVGQGVRGGDDAAPTIRAALRGVVSSDPDVQGSLVVAVPVTDGRRVVATVVARTGYAEVRWQIVGTWALMLAIALAALAVALALAQRQARRLAAPLEELSAAAQRLGEGDFSVRARASGIREIDAASASLGATAGRLGVLVRQERELAAHASHQLRTPLTALRLVLETAVDQSPRVQQAAVATALEATDRLERTIDDLLAIAHDDDPVPDPLDLPALVAEAAATAALGLRAAGRALVVDVDADLATARGSSAAVRQVLAVLLDNATVHGAGTVSIAVREASGAVAVDVGDQGGGVADPAALFAGPGRRDGRAGVADGTGGTVDGGARRAGGARGGSGLGLGLARTLSEDQGGRLVLSRARPAVFTLLLPVDVDADADAALAERAGGGPATVLRAPVAATAAAAASTLSVVRGGAGPATALARRAARLTSAASTASASTATTAARRVLAVVVGRARAVTVIYRRWTAAGHRGAADRGARRDRHRIPPRPPRA